MLIRNNLKLLSLTMIAFNMVNSSALSYGTGKKELSYNVGTLINGQRSPSSFDENIQDSGVHAIGISATGNTASSSQQLTTENIQRYISGTNYFKWGATVFEGPLLERIYSQRSFKPIWLDGNYGWTPLAIKALELIKNSRFHGLKSEFYWTKDLENASKQVMTEKNLNYALVLELGLTDSLYRFAKDISIGKINPKLVDGDQAYPQRSWSKQDWAVFYSALNSDINGSSISNLETQILSLEPQHAKYLQLKNVLTKILNTEEGPKADSAIDSIVTAGSAKNTRSELIERISANMERLRWLPPALGQRYAFVNLALQELNIFENEQSVLKMKTVNGKSFRRTVSMVTKLTDIKLNPHWTAADTPLQEDEIPAIQNDINFISNGRFFITIKPSVDFAPPVFGDNSQPHQYFENRRLLTQMEIAALPWSTMTAKEFKRRGLTLVQDSGPRNALGSIKFELDNDFSIYIHDTNRRDLFSKAVRLESSGCIRLENPPALAFYLLKNRPEYQNPDIMMNQIMNGDPVHDATIAKDVFIHLTSDEVLTVYTAFLTTEVSEDGKLRVAKDWYGIDARIMELNSVQSKSEIQNAAVESAGTLIVQGEAGPGQLFRKVVAVRCTPTEMYSCEKTIHSAKLNEPMSIPAGEYLVGFENSIYPGWVTIESGATNTLNLEKIVIPTELSGEQSVSIAKDYSSEIERLKLGSQLFYLGKYLFGAGSYSSFDDFYITEGFNSDYLGRINYSGCMENGNLAKDVQSKGLKLTTLCKSWINSYTLNELQSQSSVLDQTVKAGSIGQRFVHKGSFNGPFYIQFENRPHLVSTPIKGNQFVSVFPGSYLIYKTGKPSSGKSISTNSLNTDNFIPVELMTPDFSVFDTDKTETPVEEKGI